MTRSSYERLFARVPRHLRRSLAVGVPAVLGLLLLFGTVAYAMRGAAEAPVRPPRPIGGSLKRSAPFPATPAAPASSPAKPRAQAPAPKVLPTPAPKPKPAPPKSEVMGFYVNYDPTSLESLKRNIGQLTTFSPMWLHVGDDGRVRDDDPKAQAAVMRFIRSKRPDLRVEPIVNDFSASGGWNAPRMAELLKNPRMRARIADGIVAKARADGYSGVNVDFEGFTSSSKADLVAFARDLHSRASRFRLRVSQDVAVDGSAYDLKGLAANTDFLVPMMYDEHYGGSEPGPVASQGWYTSQLAKLFAVTPPSKVVIALGGYGRDWQAGGGGAQSLTYSSAMRTARAGKTAVSFDSKMLNATFGYSGRRAWILDAASAFDQISAVSGRHPKGFAMWRLGAEDPALWKVLAGRDKLDGRVAKSIEGRGRSVTYDPKRNLITGERIRP